MNEDEVWSEGDARRTAIIERALGEFFAGGRRTFARAFAGNDVASVLLSCEMFAFNVAALCVSVESAIPHVPGEKWRALLRSQLLSVVELGRGRLTHPDAQRLLRAALVEYVGDLAGESSKGEPLP